VQQSSLNFVVKAEARTLRAMRPSQMIPPFLHRAKGIDERNRGGGLLTSRRQTRDSVVIGSCVMKMLSVLCVVLSPWPLDRGRVWSRRHGIVSYVRDQRRSWHHRRRTRHELVGGLRSHHPAQASP